MTGAKPVSPKAAAVARVKFAENIIGISSAKPIKIALTLSELFYAAFLGLSGSWGTRI
jgi:hypothetical protein